MANQPNEQCPYYESRNVTLKVPSGSLALTAPFCRLAYVMGERLDTTPEGRAVTHLLTTTPHQGETRFMYGPDLDAISAPVCLKERLQQRCEPEFIQLLTRLGLEASLPPTE